MHRVVLILLLLLAGAVVNVAVAWGCAAWMDIDLMANQRGKATVDYPGFHGIRWERRAAARVSIFIVSRRRNDYFSRIPIDGWVPAWTGHFFDGSTIEDSYSPRLYSRRTADARGWPRLALYGGYEQSLNRERTVYPWFALMLDQPKASISYPDARFLPLRPIWPGFAANTLFYAAVLWLLIPGPFALRRLIRRRSGRCPACGYDLQHAEHDQGCPECGKEYQR